ncbi:gustatory and pheromone receptor 32a-like [Gigantopelta aegis]|uniref:gustatory and pheromone receptor 32a-like n=1 Tax=Gigantopelta aegis TaxID=1735272 RepID=UPI001B88BA57|nr:gustatory and pheromone receptor 32a-like [Gigantopelta aegis]
MKTIRIEPQQNVARAEFQLLSSRMEKSIKGITAELETSLEFVYHKHEAVCGLVDSANECFKPYLVLTLAGYIPVSCLVLYALIIEDITSIDAAILSCLMILSSMIAIFVILFAGGLVSSKADEMTGHLWKIKPAALSERGLQALSIFVTKLCHQSTGFSVYGLFTINMPAIITIFGSILAYFVVIIQFKSAESSVCPVNNCTMLP